VPFRSTTSRSSSPPLLDFLWARDGTLPSARFGRMSFIINALSFLLMAWMLAGGVC
jgi:hypothetical protein